MSARCAWAERDPLLAAHHDEEWGVPVLDSRALWETLVLGGFAAGLSWLTILRKRAAFRSAFCGFDPALVARFGTRDIERLMRDEDIVRSHPKILATIENARAYERMRADGDDLASLVWSSAGGRVSWEEHTTLSIGLADELVDRGFKFVGPIVAHGWLCATGVLNDHDHDCARRDVVEALAPG